MNIYKRSKKTIKKQHIRWTETGDRRRSLARGKKYHIKPTLKEAGSKII